MNASVFFVVPDAIDDPQRVSGGNMYDRRLRDGLRAAGWEVRMLLVTARGRGWTARTLSQLPEGALVLVDGLLAGREPEALSTHAARLRLVVLAHMVPHEPRDHEAGDRELDDHELSEEQHDALRAAQLIITTSAWTRSELIAQDAADPHRIVVAHPGADPAPATVASDSGGRLLCVAAVAPHKGQDLLVRALAGLADRGDWTCRFVGSLQVAPDFVDALTSVVEAAGLADRIAFTGVLTGPALEAEYGRADLVVLPSRSESYGMAVAEALQHGIPVLATGVGGIPEAIPPGDAAMIVPPDDPWALSVVLQQWWASRDRRSERKAAALTARSESRSWAATTGIVAAALAGVAQHGTPRTEVVPS